MKYATTFGSSSAARDSALYAEGMELGRALCEAGYIVKCGGYGGVMEAVSQGANEAGGEVIGIGLKDFEAVRPVNAYLSKKIVAKSLYERLMLLIEGSDLFVAQWGSVGTLNEIFMVLALKYGGIKPNARIVLLGEKYEKMKNSELFDENFSQNVEIYKSVEELKKRL